jgi:predicted SAM-dependent methyltransferase
LQVKGDRLGKGAPLRWIENQVLRRHLRGRGVEIGALWRKFPARSGTKVWYVDRETTDGLSAHYSDLQRPLVKPDIVGDAARLPFAPGSLDFLIASHVLEHMPFPLAALQHWYNVLAPGGTLLLRIPDKRFTFDVRRERTPLAHLVEEHAHPERFDKRVHFADFLQGVSDQRNGTADFEKGLKHLLDTDYSIHYHVWTTSDVREIIRYTVHAMKLQWQRVIDLGAHFYRKEMILLLKRS